MKSEIEKSRRINVCRSAALSFDDQTRNVNCTAVFSQKINPPYHIICSKLSMMKHKYPRGPLMFLNRLN